MLWQVASTVEPSCLRKVLYLEDIFGIEQKLFEKICLTFGILHSNIPPKL